MNKLKHYLKAENIGSDKLENHNSQDPQKPTTQKSNNTNNCKVQKFSKF